MITLGHHDVVQYNNRNVGMMYRHKGNTLLFVPALEYRDFVPDISKENWDELRDEIGQHFPVKRKERPNSVDAKISKETEAAKLILDAIADIVEDDEQAREDAIEGETDLKEVIQKALRDISECESMAVAIKDREDALKARRDRFKNRASILRSVVAKAMEDVEVKKMTFPEGTVSLRSVPPSLATQNEADIPSTYWEPQPPKLDRRRLLADLKNGSDIPGVSLTNGGSTLSIKVA
ncbi:MAG: siphovirus Gp157 family protein [Filomicrobium sp.]